MNCILFAVLTCEFSPLGRTIKSCHRDSQFPLRPMPGVVGQQVRAVEAAVLGRGRYGLLRLGRCGLLSLWHWAGAQSVVDVVTGGNAS